MMNKLIVKAAPGLKVPLESNARRYIGDGAAVEVDATAYYLRRIKFGELLDASSEPVSQPKKGVKANGES